TLIDLGRPREAAEALSRAIKIREMLGNKGDETAALARLAALLRACGSEPRAGVEETAHEANGVIASDGANEPSHRNGAVDIARASTPQSSLSLAPAEVKALLWLEERARRWTDQI